MKVKSHFRYSILALICSLLCAAVSGCSSRKNNVRSYTTPQHVSIPSSASGASKRLLSEAEKWLGTPYRYGGTTRGKGVDCSGLVMSLYSDALSIKLPRSSAEQQRFCRSIDTHHLIPGDLVFFAPRKNGRINHVGMYLGEGRMIHASTSRGVMISSLDEKYYVDNFFGFGRVAQYEALTGKVTQNIGKSESGKKDKKKKSDKKSKGTSVTPSVTSHTTSPTAKEPVPPTTRKLLEEKGINTAITSTNPPKSPKESVPSLNTLPSKTAQSSPKSNSRKTTPIQRPAPADNPDQRVDSICNAFFD